jgi:hypothetical protein
MSNQELDPYDLEEQEEQADIRRVASMLASEVEDEDFVWLMSGPRGRRIVRRLIYNSGVFQSSFRQNAMSMGHTEGKKEMGYELLSLVDRLCPKGYTTMNEEHRDVRAVTSH